MPLLIRVQRCSRIAKHLPGRQRLMATMSLDLPQIYATMTKPRPNRKYLRPAATATNVNSKRNSNRPLRQIEKQLKINIKDDLLPLLGSEIAVRLPMKNMNIIGLPSITPGWCTRPEGKDSAECGAGARDRHQRQRSDARAHAETASRRWASKAPARLRKLNDERTRRLVSLRKFLSRTRSSETSS